MRSVRGVSVRGTCLALVGLMLSGCAGTIPIRQHLGIRPDEPPQTQKATTCDEYVAYLTYAQQLQEAYHSRATHNRSWIYVAGLLGLGAAAASGGLAVVGAAGVGTLGLLAVSGGFSAGAFATMDNSTLAELYTIAANKVDAALAAVTKCGPPAPYDDVSKCKTALDDLREKVSDARIELEEARTDSAKASVARAAAALDTLRKQTAALGLSAFDVNPSMSTLVAGESLTLVISGGKPEYTVTPVSGAFTVVEQPTKANQYRVKITVANGARVARYDVVFQDSAGHIKTILVEVAPPPSGGLVGAPPAVPPAVLLAPVAPPASFGPCPRSA